MCITRIGMSGGHWNRNVNRTKHPARIAAPLCGRREVRHLYPRLGLHDELVGKDGAGVVGTHGSVLSTVASNVTIRGSLLRSHYFIPHNEDLVMY